MYEEYTLHYKFNGRLIPGQPEPGCIPAPSWFLQLCAARKTYTYLESSLPFGCSKWCRREEKGSVDTQKITSRDLIKTTEPVSLVIYGRFEPMPPEGENEGISSTLADFNNKVKSDVPWPSSERRLRSPCYPNYFWLDLWDVCTAMESSHNQVPALMGEVQSLLMPQNPCESIRNLQQKWVINGMFHGEKGTPGIFPPLPAGTWPPQELRKGLQIKLCK